MPQPALSVTNYISSALPFIVSDWPQGIAGGKTARPTYEGPFKAIQLIDAFKDKVAAHTASLPTNPVAAHPTQPYPNLGMESRSIKAFKSEAELLSAVKRVPLDGLLSVLSALGVKEAPGMSEVEGKKGGGANLDGEDGEGHSDMGSGGGTSALVWKVGKSPMGDTEFLLSPTSTAAPVLVVRVIPDALFALEDWEEFSTTGKFTYNPKSKASWWWSRQVAGAERNGVKWFVMTSYTYWCVGVFGEGYEGARISPVMKFDDKSPSILEALTFWARSALGSTGGYRFEPISTQELKENLFPNNPARRASMNKGKNRPRPEQRFLPKLSNESDVEDSDAA